MVMSQEDEEASTPTEGTGNQLHAAGGASQRQTADVETGQRMEQDDEEEEDGEQQEGEGEGVIVGAEGESIREGEEGDEEAEEEGKAETQMQAWRRQYRKEAAAKAVLEASRAKARAKASRLRIQARWRFDCSIVRLLIVQLFGCWLNVFCVCLFVLSFLNAHARTCQARCRGYVAEGSIGAC
jgi:hypothetical protein